MIFEPPKRLAKQQCLKGLIRSGLMAALILTVQTVQAPRESQERTFIIQQSAVEETPSKFDLSPPKDLDISSQSPTTTITPNKEVNKQILENLQVNNLEKDLPLLISYLTKRVDRFQAGQLSHKLCEWRKLNSDSEVQCTVWGEEIEFSSLLYQLKAPKQNTFSGLEQLAVEQEIKKSF